MSNEKKLYVARPRGFCAGVDRAIDIVELALEVYGAPLYVKHAIVHNTHVVKRLEEKGVQFPETVDEIPEGSRAVFSAHGSPPGDYEQARRRNIEVIDATCPLVTKVHLEVRRFSRLGYDIIMIGHKNHVEPVGTLGNAKDSSKTYLIEEESEVGSLEVRNPAKVAVVTQTTLSVDETEKTLSALKKKFPEAEFPKKEDICYATTNRQRAVKNLLPHIEALLIVGSKTSSNSNRLKELGVRAGIYAALIDDSSEIDAEAVEQFSRIGISSGASVPDDLVENVVAYFVSRGYTEDTIPSHVEEDVHFALPVDLVKAAREKKAGNAITDKHHIAPGQKMNV